MFDIIFNKLADGLEQLSHENYWFSACFIKSCRWTYKGINHISSDYEIIEDNHKNGFVFYGKENH